jgi:hypothetical protein
MPFSRAACASDFFECTQCGQCCQGYGGTYVSEADIAAIAQHLAVDGAEVRTRYCVLSGGRPLLAQRPDGCCIFFDKNCGIHAVKPRMCRRWPFIPGVLVDIGNWRAMADSCPGIRTDVDEGALCQYIRYALDLENR